MSCPIGLALIAVSQWDQQATETAVPNMRNQS